MNVLEKIKGILSPRKAELKNEVLNQAESVGKKRTYTKATLPDWENEIILNQEYAATLRRDGVVKIPFLNEEELKRIQDYQEELHNGQNPDTMFEGIHMTIWDPKFDYKSSIRAKLKELVSEASKRTFGKHRQLSHQFIIKKKGNETTFPIHQDWCVVNEDKYLSINIWIPLHDVDETNGAMWIIKKSHLIDRKIRGAGYLFPDFNPIFEELKPYMTNFSMKAGEALLFYHRTIHGSPANLTRDKRIVIQLGVIPEEAPMEIYFQSTPESQLEVHNPADDFNLHYKKITEESKDTPPTNHPTEIREPYHVENVTLEEVLASIS